MPLALTTEEMDLLLALAAPIDQRCHHQFLTEVTAELDAAAAQTGVWPRPGAGAPCRARGPTALLGPAAGDRREQISALNP